MYRNICLCPHLYLSLYFWCRHTSSEPFPPVTFLPQIMIILIVQNIFVLIFSKLMSTAEYQISQCPWPALSPGSIPCCVPPHCVEDPLPGTDHVRVSPRPGHLPPAPRPAPHPGQAPGGRGEAEERSASVLPALPVLFLGTQHGGEGGGVAGPLVHQRRGGQVLAEAEAFPRGAPACGDADLVLLHLLLCQAHGAHSVTEHEGLLEPDQGQVLLLQVLAPATPGVGHYGLHHTDLSALLGGVGAGGAPEDYPVCGVEVGRGEAGVGGEEPGGGEDGDGAGGGGDHVI